MTDAITPETCPEAAFHGNPFRYCGVKGCGWIEDAPAEKESLVEIGGQTMTQAQFDAARLPLRQEYANVKSSPTGPAAGRFYGDGGTIHHNTDLDVEIRDGVVVAVWFRCLTLPFRVTEVAPARAADMVSMYAGQPAPSIIGVQVVDA